MSRHNHAHLHLSLKILIMWKSLIMIVHWLWVTGNHTMRHVFFATHRKIIISHIMHLAHNLLCFTFLIALDGNTTCIKCLHITSPFASNLLSFIRTKSLVLCQQACSILPSQTGDPGAINQCYYDDYARHCMWTINACDDTLNLFGMV